LNFSLILLENSLLFTDVVEKNKELIRNVREKNNWQKGLPCPEAEERFWRLLI
jgi:hypothetical protein